LNKTPDIEGILLFLVLLVFLIHCEYFEKELPSKGNFKELYSQQIKLKADVAVYKSTYELFVGIRNIHGRTA
jgi:hypothetical protein